MPVRELVCGTCGEVNRASAGPCSWCGEQLEQPAAPSAALPPGRALRADEIGAFRICPRCRADNRTEAAFCWRCQATFHRLSPPTEVSQPRQLGSFLQEVPSTGLLPTHGGRTASGTRLLVAWTVLAVAALAIAILAAVMAAQRVP